MNILRHHLEWCHLRWRHRCHLESSLRELDVISNLLFFMLINGCILCFLWRRCILLEWKDLCNLLQSRDILKFSLNYVVFSSNLLGCKLPCSSILPLSALSQQKRNVFSLVSHLIRLLLLFSHQTPISACLQVNTLILAHFTQNNVLTLFVAKIRCSVLELNYACFSTIPMYQHSLDSWQSGLL